MIVARPFLQPVDLNKYPDYIKIIQEPMSLSLVKRKVLDCFDGATQHHACGSMTHDTTSASTLSQLTVFPASCSDFVILLSNDRGFTKKKIVMFLCCSFLLLVLDTFRSIRDPT
jgi:hypothetical protein